MQEAFQFFVDSNIDHKKNPKFQEEDEVREQDEYEEENNLRFQTKMFKKCRRWQKQRDNLNKKKMKGLNVP